MNITNACTGYKHSIVSTAVMDINSGMNIESCYMSVSVRINIIWLSKVNDGCLV